MRKITLSFLCCLISSLGFSQDDCASAIAITEGIYTVDAIDGTEVPSPICAANGGGATANMDVEGSVLKAGISYVTGDITLAVGVTSGEGKDSDFGATTTADDSKDTMSGSVTYAVASGVSAVVGYLTEDHQDDGASATTGGSSWYIGATMSF